MEEGHDQSIREKGSSENSSSAAPSSTAFHRPRDNVNKSKKRKTEPPCEVFSVSHKKVSRTTGRTKVPPSSTVVSESQLDSVVSNPSSDPPDPARLMAAPSLDSAKGVDSSAITDPGQTLTTSDIDSAVKDEMMSSDDIHVKEEPDDSYDLENEPTPEESEEISTAQPSEPNTSTPGKKGSSTAGPSNPAEKGRGFDYPVHTCHTLIHAKFLALFYKVDSSAKTQENQNLLRKPEFR